MKELTKNQLAKWGRDNLLPNADGSQPTSKKDVDTLRQNRELLDKAAACYRAGSDQRRDYKRLFDYYKGYQMEDMIADPDGEGMISEGDYIRRQGNVPIILNMIPRLVQPVVGEFCGKQLEPFILARNSAKRKVGKVLTELMRQAYEECNAQQLDVEEAENLAVGGAAIFRMGYAFNEEKQRYGIRLVRCENNSMLYDDPSGQYFENVALIGQLHDFREEDLYAEFAKSKQDIDRIHAIYKNCADANYIRKYFSRDYENVDKDFFVPTRPNMCRVIELWRKEGYFSYNCHDVQKGEAFTILEEDRHFVDEENAKRMQEWIAQGGDPTQCPLIVCYDKDGEDRPIYNRVWVCYYMSPDGYILKRETSPYDHGEHPFVMGMRTCGGEITSIAKMSITTQRMINRLATAIESERISDTKGLMVWDDDILKASHVTKEEADEVAAKPNGSIALKYIEGHKPFQRFNSSSNSAANAQMMQFYMSTMADQSGVHGPYRGEEAKSGTPASLLMQETQNASNNVAPLLKWYEGLIIKRNWKMLRLILQYTEDGKIVRIAGEDGKSVDMPFSKQDIKDADIDLYMTQSRDNGPLFIANEDKLYNMAVAGMISPRVYLQNSKADYAEAVLQAMEEEQNIAQQQQTQMQMAQAQQPIVQQ